MVYFELAKLIPTTGPLHRIFSSSGMFFPQVVSYLTFILFIFVFKYHPFREAFPTVMSKIFLCAALVL